MTKIGLLCTVACPMLGRVSMGWTVKVNGWVGSYKVEWSYTFSKCILSQGTGFC